MMALAACLQCGALLGQDVPATRAHVVQGVVFDSVAGAPLAGADVQLASRGDGPAPIATIADANGRFRIETPVGGEYLIGFYHPVLEVLGLDGPSRVITIGDDSLLTVALAIPSIGAVRRLRCGPDSTDNAMLVGQLHRNPPTATRDAASISAEWGALVIESSALRTITLRATGSVDANGYYQICGVPAGAPLTVRVAANGKRSIIGTVEIAPSGIARRDFVLSDAAATRGSALIRAHVVREDGTPVASGRASIPALGREVPVANGAFEILGLPAGTWQVDVRAMGLDPASVLAESREESPPDVTVRLTEIPQYLEAVTVVEKVTRNGRVLDDVLRRQRASSGSFFFAGHPALRSALNVAEVVKEARGFRYINDTSILGRPPFGIKCKGLAVYVNGIKVGLNADGLEALKELAKPQDVLAVEAYPDVLFTPMQWRTGDACSVLVVWTKI
ncbi:MAG: peptidase associated/transthyretin-like domain-containing protein [Gemmatimonadaceae bacterium]